MLYYLSASILGAGWMLVLLIPRWTAEWIREAPGWSALPMIAGSVITAFLFKDWICSARTLGQHALRALVISYAGCLVFLLLLNVVIELENLRVAGRFHAHNCVARFGGGLSASIAGFYVVVPYGFVCQLVMNWIGRK